MVSHFFIKQEAKHWCIIVLSWLAAILMLAPASALADARSEAIKSGFVYNFAKFTTWPAESSGDKTIAFEVIGKHPFGESIKAIRKKQIGGRQIVIHFSNHFKADIDFQILFISASEKQSLKEILAAVQGEPILTVSDIPGFTDAGGMIGLLEVGNNIRFTVNLESCRQSGLMLSSQMLRLAESITGNSMVPK